MKLHGPKQVEELLWN